MMKRSMTLEQIISSWDIRMAIGYL